MTIQAPPGTVAVDADIVVQLVGVPNRAVTWTLINSAGTLTVFNTTTDNFGHASAMFSPGVGEEGVTATIQAEYGD